MSLVKFRRPRVIRFYADPGHGWAKVSFAELKQLGIVNAITAYSYMRNGFAYLEEDCDLSTYCKALERADIAYSFKGSTAAYRSSRIRSYDRYDPLAV